MLIDSFPRFHTIGIVAESYTELPFPVNSTQFLTTSPTKPKLGPGHYCITIRSRSRNSFPRRAGRHVRLHSQPFFALASHFWARYFTKDDLKDSDAFSQRLTSSMAPVSLLSASPCAPCTRAFGASPPHSKPSCASSTLVLLPRMARTSRRTRVVLRMCMTRRADLGGGGAWHRWNEEFDFILIAGSRTAVMGTR